MMSGAVGKVTPVSHHEWTGYVDPREQPRLWLL